MEMINERNARQFCNGDITKIRRYAEAIADETRVWDLHHCLGLVYSIKELKEQGLYYKQPPEYLMFATHKDHLTLHRKFMSDELKEKLREANTGSRNGFYGKTHSDESRKKMSDAAKGKTPWNKGVKQTEEQIENNRKAQLKYAKEHPEQGRKHSEFMKEYNATHESKCNKKVYQYDKNMNLVKIWKSAAEAGRNGFSPTHISGCCKGIRKSSGGFYWRHEPVDQTSK